MKEKDTPGAPPSTESPKPKPVNDSLVSFAYNDLIFDDFFISENRKFVRFYVEGKDCYVEMTYSDFTEYQLTIWEMKNKLNEEDAECICDKTTPSADLIGTVTINVEIEDPETHERQTITDDIPVYFIYSIIEGISVGNMCNVKKK